MSRVRERFARGKRAATALRLVLRGGDVVVQVARGTMLPSNVARGES